MTIRDEATAQTTLPHPRPGRAPNFFIGGEQKAGTGYLYANLRHHREVFMTQVKEPLFFSSYRYESAQIDGYVQEHFAGAADERWRGEASASYFHSETAAARIEEAFGTEIKFLFCLRHPTEKAVSLYLHNFRRGRLRGHERLGELESTPFRVRQFTLHSEHCARFLEIFGSGNVHFLLFQTLRFSPESFVNSAYSFLGLQPERRPLPRFVNKGNDLEWKGDVLTIAGDDVLSEGQMRPEFHRSELEAWHETMQPDIERTEQVTGLDLGDWKRFPRFAAVALLLLQLVVLIVEDAADIFLV